jgi:anti-sigma-K factor RskA
MECRMNKAKRTVTGPRPGSWRDLQREALAQRHALGLLSPGAERSFQAWLAQDARLQASVRGWEAVLAQLSMHTPPLEPSAGLWRRIEGQLGPAPAAARPRFGAGLLTALARLLDSTVLRMGGSALAGALAVAIVVAPPTPAPVEAVDAAMPASYVGVLTDAGDQAQLVVASLRYSHQVQLKLLKPLAVPQGSGAVLWGIRAGAAPQLIARIPHGDAPRVTLTLDRPAEQVFAGFTRLAVSIEPDDEPSSAGPSQPFVISGHCAKVW